MQAVRSVAWAAARAVSAARAGVLPAAALRAPAAGSGRSRVAAGTLGSRALVMGRAAGLLTGGMRGLLPLGAVLPPALAPQRVLLGWEQTRSMRHGQRRGKLGRSAKER
jgi:hypothetical protein